MRYGNLTKKLGFIAHTPPTRSTVVRGGGLRHDLTEPWGSADEASLAIFDRENRWLACPHSWPES